MAHYHYHCESSVKMWGGSPGDYMEIHRFIDSSKVAVADVRHRAMLHHTLGTEIAEKIFGVTITNSDGKKVPVREIAERHIIEDLGFLPTPADYTKCISLKAAPWVGGKPERLKEKGVPVSRSVMDRVEGSRRKRDECRNSKGKDPAGS